MKLFTWGALVLVLSPLAGCVASRLVFQERSPDGTPTRGSVQYLNQGADFVIERRRADAEVKMHDFCGGPDYFVRTEQANSSTSGYMASQGFGGNTIFTQVSSEYVTLNFECGTPAH